MSGRNIRLTAPDGVPVGTADFADDFAAAEKSGSFRIGRRAFYYREGLRRRCVPYTALDSVTLEPEPIDTHCSCCSVQLTVFHLILRGGGRQIADIRLEDERLALIVHDKLSTVLAAVHAGRQAV